MTSYMCLEVNTLHKTLIKATSSAKAIEALYRQIPTATAARVVGKGYIHYNTAP